MRYSIKIGRGAKLYLYSPFSSHCVQPTFTQSIYKFQSSTVTVVLYSSNNSTIERDLFENVQLKNGSNIQYLLCNKGKQTSKTLALSAFCLKSSDVKTQRFRN